MADTETTAADEAAEIQNEDTAKIHLQDVGDGLDQQGLGQSGHTGDQHVTATEQGNQQLINH